jgi:small subunit ribosomal protein S6e
VASDNVLKGVVNDTDPKSGGRSYAVDIIGSNYNHFMGKKIGDVVDGIFVGEGDSTLAGFKLKITGGTDKIGTPMRGDVEGGNRKAILVTDSVGFKPHKLIRKKGKLYRWRYKGLRRRRMFRGNTVNQDTIQLNLKVVEQGNKKLEAILGAGAGAEES